MITYFFEDFKTGDTYNFTIPAMSKAEIMAFATTWDPQPIHVDEEVAAKFQGGIIASGYHTMLAALRPMLASVMAKSANIGGPGMKHIHWLSPVRPGDRLQTKVTVAKTHASRSKPGRGLVSFDVETTNDADIQVMTFQFAAMISRRTPAVPA
jgi:acyl dehydratase